MTSVRGPPQMQHPTLGIIPCPSRLLSPRSALLGFSPGPKEGGCCVVGRGLRGALRELCKGDTSWLGVPGPSHSPSPAGWYSLKHMYPSIREYWCWWRLYRGDLLVKKQEWIQSTLKSHTK